MNRKVQFLVLIFVSLFLFGAAQEKSYLANSFDVDVVVQDDGALLVTETIEFAFTGGPFTFVFRDIPTDHTDGVTVQQASVDGVANPRGDQAGQVEIDGGSIVQVRWNFEPVSNATRTYTLVYEVAGVVRQAEDSDRLIWQALPDEYEYRILESTTTIHYPDGVSPVGEVEVQAGAPQVESNSQFSRYTMQNLSPNSPLVVAVDFPAGSIIDAAPGWQAQEQQAGTLIPWWIVSGLAVAGIGLMLVLYLSNANRRPAPKISGRVYEPPTDMPPALAGALAGANGEPAWANALAAIFDLAERGVLSIRETAEGKWYKSKEFTILLEDRSHMERSRNLRPHEEVLLKLLFEDKEGRRVEEVKMSDISGRLGSKKWDRFKDAMKAEIKAAGYLDLERQAQKKRWLATGLLTLLLGVAIMFALLILFMDSFGGWVLIPAFAIQFVGVTFLVLSASYSPLSERGLVAAETWKPFFEHLKQVSRDKAAPGKPDAFYRYLPYAATYGLLHAWAKSFEKRGWEETPAWFYVMPHTHGANMGAFVAMTGTISSSGGSAAGAAGAGAAGAGAAGGGASGAG